jgi:hypothetical protein
MEHAMQIYKNHRGITTVNKHLPFVWRVNYLHEAPLPETVPEIAHEKARQILQKNRSRAGQRF